jgi:hypothetical protein
VDVLIARAVRGKPSPWPFDPDYEWQGSFEATYRSGDKQILLWAIDDCAQNGLACPKWAADALHEILMNGVARAKLSSWEDAFGPLVVEQQRKIQTRRHIVGVWLAVREIRSSSKDWENIFENVAQEFGIGITKVKEYYGKMQTFMEAHGPSVCMELDQKSIRD